MDLPITLSAESKQPLYRQLCDALREAIIQGRLRPGEALPSSRALANMLELSRVTVVRSYEELMCQGYIEATHGTGTCVSRHLSLSDHAAGVKPAESADRSKHFSTFARYLLSAEPTEFNETVIPELNYGAVPHDLLPLKDWRSLYSRHARAEESAHLIYETDPFGYPPLREALAGYLKRARAIACHPDQVVLFTTAQHTLNVTARILVESESTVALESSGYCDARQAFLAQKARLHPVPVDEQGIVVDELFGSQSSFRLVFVSPVHHSPSGACLSQARRESLLDWARSTDTVIIEDDHGHEYRYFGKPVAALKELDRDDMVITFGSFTNTLFPLTSLHYLVIPRWLVPVYRRAKILSQRTFSIIEQYVLADLIESGLYERHIQKTRQVYARRRRSLIAGLKRSLGDRITIAEPRTGTCLPVRLHLDHSEEELLDLARKAGLPMCSTKSFYLHRDESREDASEFLVAFGHLSEDDLEQSARRFSISLEEAGRDPISRT